MSEDNPLVALTVKIVASYVAHTKMRADDLPGVIAMTHATIATLKAAPKLEPDAAGSDAASKYQRAVSLRKSLASRDHIISMINGKPYKTLKRHIERHGLTAAEYRKRYGLGPDYPMTAPSHSELRSNVAKALGFGRKPKPETKSSADEAEETERTSAVSDLAHSDAGAGEAAVMEPVTAKRARKAKPKAHPGEPQPPKRRGRQPKAAVPTDMAGDQ